MWFTLYVDYSLVSILVLKDLLDEKEHLKRISPNIKESSRSGHLDDVRIKSEEKYKKLVLGRLIGVIRKRELLSIELINRLTLYKDERNHIIHESISAHGDDMYSKNGRENYFKRLDEFTENSRCLQKQIAEVHLKLCEDAGLRIDLIDRDGKRNLAMLINKEE